MTTGKKFRSEGEKRAWGIVGKMDRVHSSYMVRDGVAGSMASVFIRRWVKNGWLEEIERDDEGRKIYGHKNRPQKPIEDSFVCKTPEDAMWIVMTRFRTFTPLDLAEHGSVGDIEVSLKKARTYCQKLLAAEYLKMLETPIQGAREGTYKLVNRTGACAPRLRQVNGIYDPNTREFFPNLREDRA